MKLTISPRAEKQLRKLSKLDQIAVAQKIRGIAQDTALVGEEKLKGFQSIFRVRIGDYRIVYRRMHQETYVILIGHRRDIYKLLKRLLG